jgi:hypothetical protein
MSFRNLAVGAIAAMTLLVPSTANAWTSRVTVGDKVAVWQSRQVFASDDLVRLRVFVDGHELPSEDASMCSSWISGRGVMIRADSCGPRLKLRIASARLQRVVVRIHYYRI